MPGFFSFFTFFCESRRQRSAIATDVDRATQRHARARTHAIQNDQRPHQLIITNAGHISRNSGAWVTSREVLTHDA
jgi:hypothetical protein